MENFDLTLWIFVIQDKLNYMLNIYENPISQPIAEEPKKSSKKIILYIIFGLAIIIIGILYFRGLSLTKKLTKSNIDQVQFTVDITCAAYHAANKTNIWNVDLSNITFNQASSKYPEFYQALEPNLQLIMQKYNLNYNSLEEEHKKMTILMQTDSSFNKRVTDIYLKSKCLSRP